MKTLEELIQMTYDELRVMLAGLCGFESINVSCWRGHRGGFEVSIPSYPLKLDACRELEMPLVLADPKMGKKAEYGNNLAKVVGFKSDNTWGDDFLMICATAHQRTIALILTLQKP